MHLMRIVEDLKFERLGFHLLKKHGFYAMIHLLEMFMFCPNCIFNIYSSPVVHVFALILALRAGFSRRKRPLIKRAMGNLTCKFAGHSKKKSQQCIETSKIPCLGIPIKKKGDLGLENEKMTAGKKIGSNPEKENLDLENGKKTATKTNGNICSNPVTQSSIFPLEIFIEILSRVPVKYLPKIQLVCKHWCHVVQDRQFLKKQMSQAPSLAECNYKPKNAPDHETFKSVSACDGLVLRTSNTTRKYHIKNRTTKQILELPDPHKRSFGVTFSFVPCTLNYKLVSIVDCGVESLIWIHLGIIVVLMLVFLANAYKYSY